MKIARHTIEIVLVAVVAFAVGRSDLSAGATPAVAQAKDERGPTRHHRHLDQLIGVWTVEYTMRSAADAPPIISRGMIKREWTLGGHFVRERLTATKSDAKGAIQGIGYIGYNDLDGRYELVWMSSMSTAIEYETGMYHPDNKVMHWRGETHDPVTGRLINSWGKLDMSDPDRHVFTGYSVDVDGRTFKATEGVATRVERAR